MMIKPDGYKHKDEIINRLKLEGLTIEAMKEIKVDMHVMQILLIHYEEVIDKMGKDFNFVGKLFNSFYFGENYIIPMVVRCDDCDIIKKTRSLVGATNPIEASPNSIRSIFSHDSYDKADKENRLVNNVIHASDSPLSAQKELNLWRHMLN